MKYMAQWGPKAFLVTPGVFLPIEKMSSQRKAKTEKLNADDTSDKTVIKGLEPKTVTLDTICLSAAGIDPLKQIEEWEALTGHTASLYIGGVKFCQNMMYLDNVNSSEFVFNNNGKILQVKLSLTFNEYLEDNLYLTPHGIEQGDEIKRALSYTASAADRAAKKV